MTSRRPLHLFRKFGVVLLAYVALAYFALPAGWHFYETHRAPGPEVLRTVTTIGIPGDPLNVALSGSEADLDRIMARAGWFRAEPITLASSLGIARSVLLGSPDNHAPVSTLMFRNRPQDLAYEKPITLDADRRHHVRFWRVSPPDAPGPPLWYGAATEDVAVGLNHLTGQFTHHINPDIDRERDALLADLNATKLLGPITDAPGIGPVERGRNGEYDLFFTDGLIKRATIQPEA